SGFALDCFYFLIARTYLYFEIEFFKPTFALKKPDLNSLNQLLVQN
ncbi:10045_t:CDS:1, partial [Dentiscutata heterogama]